MLAAHRTEDTFSSPEGGPHYGGQQQQLHPSNREDTLVHNNSSSRSTNPFNREDRLSSLAAHRMEDTFSSPEDGPLHGGHP